MTSPLWSVEVERPQLPTVIEVEVPGPPGPVGPPGPEGPPGGGGFNFTQPVPSATWIINHNLGFRPDTTLYTVGNVKFEARVTNPTVNQTIVEMTTPLAGTARLI